MTSLPSMAVILRLQGLNVEAGSGDIRKFFHGLCIPDGAVHIIGGKLGEAFIIFTSERDGQLAIRQSGKLLRGSTVTLHISSFAELKHKMTMQLKKQKGSSVAKNPAPKTAVTHSVKLCEHQIRGEEIRSSKPGYLRLYGFPNTITKQEIYNFLGALSVLDVMVNVFQGRDQCCLVKVVSIEEAERGLKYSRITQLGSSIQVRLAHERLWTNAVEECEKTQTPTSSDQERLSPELHSGKRRLEDRLIAGSPKQHCSEDRLLPGSRRRHCAGTMVFVTEYCVMVQNLPKNITKTEIRGLFSCPNIPNNKIIHVLNKWGERTPTAFIVFSHPEGYASAMNMDGSLFGTKPISVSSITKEKMREILHKNKLANMASSNALTTLSYIYARNFPADVSKLEVSDFFGAYGVCEWNVTLLEDNGRGIGEAVVQLPCEQRARDARQALNGKLFMGEQILLVCVSPQQTKAILHKA
ncbi:RNA binding motif protein 12Ba [Electrophorus electricus]|uniref:RNA binding motif protein 12Ba n=1 Tax=Electrophorus electricus TaxID=8005 RepID=UPI0015D060D9|nr:RNA binding motif protein 12Ba [Electrophorus electricus]